MANKTINVKGSNISQDSTHRLVTDTEKSTWNGKANSSHTHSIANITNLQTSLDSKAPKSHTHTKSQITDFPTALKNPNSIVIKLNGGTTEGTNMFTYDGSSSKSINITADALGISTSGAYLPLTGGTMTGNIGYVTTPGGGLPYAGSFPECADYKFTANMKSFMGTYFDGKSWYSTISIRHRNGENDGANYGLIIKCDLTGPNTEHLRFIRNYGKDKWTDEITILDSTGGTVNGILNTKGGIQLGNGGTWWLGGKTVSDCIIGTPHNNDGYFPVIRVNGISGHVANFGGINDEIGFYGWLSNRTDNGVDWYTCWHMDNGIMEVSGDIMSHGIVSTTEEYACVKSTHTWNFGAGSGTGNNDYFGFHHSGKGCVCYITKDGAVVANRFTGTASTLAAGGGNGSGMTFHWEGKTGQPTWLWGGDNVGDQYVYNPANFSVATAAHLTGTCNDLSGGTTRTPIASADGESNYVAYISSRSGSIAVCGKFGSSKFDTKTINLSSSDIRLKGNIKDSTVEALPFINKIKIRQFDWIEEDNRHQDIGFVADELEELDPNLSSGGGYTEDGFRDLKSVNTFYLDGYIVKSIQELSKENNSLRDEINDLKKILAELQSKIN